MTPSRLTIVVLVALGCVIASSLAKPAKGKAAAGGGGGGGGGGAEGGAGGAGGPEVIKAKPEDTKSYTNTADNNLFNLQNKVDQHFMKRKKEGDQITKYGDHSRKENEVMQQKVEEGQYKTVGNSFDWAGKEMDESVKEAGQEADGEGGDEGGDGGAPASAGAKGGAKAKAAEPAPAPAPAADNDED